MDRFRSNSMLAQSLVGLAAAIWLMARSGTSPRRLTYPCQRIVLPMAMNWLAIIAAGLGGVFVARTLVRATGVAALGLASWWAVSTLPGRTESAGVRGPLPVWQVDDPVSSVFVLDSLPPSPGSLAAGDATVPDESLHDPAMDTLMAMMEAKGFYLHRTATHHHGVVGADNVVILKANLQWEWRNTTNTDRIKGLIWQILHHPDGFEGFILVCDNTQDLGTGIGQGDNNSDDPQQSIVDVVQTFAAKGYPVGYLDWNYIWSTTVDEFEDLDSGDGYVYDPETKVTYPKFTWLHNTTAYHVSLRRGLWNPETFSYQPERLCVIDVPVLKAHFWGGATVAVKNWVGVMTTAHAEERYGSWDAMHESYIFGEQALAARVMAQTFPRLSIVDATWTTIRGPIGPAVETRVLLASTDPVAVSWYSAKYVLTPVAETPAETNPDLPGGLYATILGRWTDYLALAGFHVTGDSTEISVYDRQVLASATPDIPRRSGSGEMILNRVECAPNPGASIGVRVDLVLPADVTVRVFTLDGRLVRTLIHREMRWAGLHEVIWDGRDEDGAPVASGAYLCRVHAGTQSTTARLMLRR